MEFEWKNLEKKFFEDFEEVLGRLDRNYRKLYTSRINPEMLANVIVTVYGSDMKLQELSNIQIPAARTLVIKPYDPSTISDIVKGIQKTHPEFSPVVQSDHIKIILNPPTEESRKKSVKEAKEYLEQAKIGIRNLRKECMDVLKKADSLTEDQEKKYMNQIDAEVKKMNSRVEEIFSSKEKELMTI